MEKSGHKKEEINDKDQSCVEYNETYLSLKRSLPTVDEDYLYSCVNDK